MGSTIGRTAIDDNLAALAGRSGGRKRWHGFTGAIRLRSTN